MIRLDIVSSLLPLFSSNLGVKHLLATAVGREIGYWCCLSQENGKVLIRLLVLTHLSPEEYDVSDLCLETL